MKNLLFQLKSRFGGNKGEKNRTKKRSMLTPKPLNRAQRRELIRSRQLHKKGKIKA